MMTKLFKKRFLSLLKWLWIVSLIIFIFYHLKTNWEQIENHYQAWNFNLFWAILAMSVSFFRRFLGAIRWSIISFSSTEKTSLSILCHMKIFFISNLSSYIPGSFWYMLSRIQRYKKMGIPVLQVSINMIFETILIIWTGILIGAPIIHTFLNISFIFSYSFFFLIFIVSLFLILPKNQNIVINFLFKLLMLEKKKTNIKPKMFFLSFVLSFCIWFFWGISLSCWMIALQDNFNFSFCNSLKTTSVFALSWVIGFLAPWAPSGLGVREGLAVIGIREFLPATTIIAATILLRLNSILDDVLWAFIAYIIPSESSDYYSKNPKKG